MSTCLNLHNKKLQQTISKENKNYLRSTRSIYLSPYLFFYSQMRNLQSSQGKHWPGLEVFYWNKAAATPGKDIKALLRGQLSCKSSSGLELYVCFSLRDKWFFPKTCTNCFGVLLSEKNISLKAEESTASQELQKI